MLLRPWQIYLITVFFILVDLAYVVPAMSNDLSDYQKYEDVFVSAKVETTKTKNGLETKVKSVLIVETENGRQWRFTDSKSEYWEELKDEKNSGKTYRFYSSRKNQTNPNRAEIDGEILYDLDDSDTYIFLVLGLSVFMIFYSFYTFRNSFRNNNREQQRKINNEYN